jgi:hypothetical protein
MRIAGIIGFLIQTEPHPFKVMVIHHRGGWKIMGQITPLAACPVDIKNGIPYFVIIYLSRTIGGVGKFRFHNFLNNLVVF